MNLLVAYDRARAAIAEAKTVKATLEIRDQIEHVKLHARQVQDRDLLADATELQLRTERHLGELLAAAKQAGHLREGRPAKAESVEEAPATLSEIGVDRKLSATAQRAAAMNEAEFEGIVAGARDKVKSGSAILVDPIKAARQGDKKEQRAARERELAAKQTALPDKRYGVIYADPEWRFEVYSRDTGMDRAADNHYPTSETDAICARPVQDIAAADCVLFLWATVPMLPDALRVLAAWGFGYKSHSIWAKDRIGTGYWFRNQHELLLVGTRGDVPAPAMGTQFPSLISAPVGEHSQKPDKFYELIETYFPTLPKIELNARRARAGWDRWGFEADAAGEAA
jgi:N6-adenosine-specific RNA methylase IME4